MLQGTSLLEVVVVWGGEIPVPSDGKSKRGEQDVKVLSKLQNVREFPSFLFFLSPSRFPPTNIY